MAGADRSAVAAHGSCGGGPSGISAEDAVGQGIVSGREWRVLGRLVAAPGRSDREDPRPVGPGADSSAGGRADADERVAVERDDTFGEVEVGGSVEQQVDSSWSSWR